MVSVYTDIQKADAIFAGKIKTTILVTRDRPYGGSGTEYEGDYRDHQEWYTSSSDNKLFLLSCEEVNYGYREDATVQPYADNAVALYGVTTGTAVIRTSANHVLFGNRNSRKANIVGETMPTSTEWWWLRSPAGDAAIQSACRINGNGVMGYGSIQFNAHGVRPACWV